MTKEKEEEEVKEPERHEYKRAGYTGSSQQKKKERERAASYTIWPLTGGWVPRGRN